MSRPGTLAWFARHEFRLAWRDWLAMMTAGGRVRTRTVAIALVIFAVVMHVIAYAMVSRHAGNGRSSLQDSSLPDLSPQNLTLEDTFLALVAEEAVAA